MRTLLAVLIVAAPALAFGRPWMGITPGESTRAEVIKKFGEPKKSVAQGEKEILGYTGSTAVSGSKQTQVTIGANGKVEQIAVFPATPLEAAEIEEVYGKACAAYAGGGEGVVNCYAKQLTDDFKPVYRYRKAGLIVFFAADKKTVQSLVFTSADAPARAK